MRFRMKKLPVIYLLLMLAAFGPVSLADGDTGAIAPDITDRADIRLSINKSRMPLMFDGNYKTEWRDDDNGFMVIRLPEDKPCHTLYILTQGKPDKLCIEEPVDGKWRQISLDFERFNTHCIPLDGLTEFRVRVTDGALRVIELRLYGAGQLPDNVVNYTSTTDKADLMILACHPDDDILWMGGLLPVYGGQLDMKVQMVYMTSHFHYRRCEAMDAMWHCGLKSGPVFLGLQDIEKMPYQEILNAWGGEEATEQLIARQIRRFRPEVLVTQDIKGEYGHPQHRLMTRACIRAIAVAADPDEESLSDLPPWEVKKFYIHLYPENALTLDMDRPLSAFGGKTPGQVAQEAYLFHVSQQAGPYKVAVDGPYDMKKYGLYHTAVGPDEAHDGLFENIDGLYEREKAFYHAEP